MNKNNSNNNYYNDNATTAEEFLKMSSEKAASRVVAAPVVGTSDDSRFHMSEATIEWNANPLVEGALIQIGSILNTISLPKERRNVVVFPVHHLGRS